MSMKISIVQSQRTLRSCLLLGLVPVVLVPLVLTLGACQTVKGLGQDIQYAGEKTEQAIDNSKK
jgi:predicted small secreted protein